MQTIRNFTPFHFQKKSIEKGIQSIQKYNSLLLASETGLGKTIVAATIALNVSPQRVLVVSPKANQKAWVSIMSGMNCVVSGNRAIPDYKDNFDFVIIDEAHKIGTSQSATFMSLFKLIAWNQSKVILISATPYNNNMESFIDLLTLCNLPQKERVIIDIFSRKINQATAELNLFAKIYGEGFENLGSLRRVGEYASYTHQKDSNIKNLGSFISSFTIRDERTGIEVLPTEHLLERFPTKNKIELSGFIPEMEKYAATLKLIDKLTFAWQNQVKYFIPENDSNFGVIYRTTLFKLFESSHDAFMGSLRRTVDTIRKALEKPSLKIGETVYELTDSFKTDLSADLEVFDSLIEIWNNVTYSNKVESLFDVITNSEGKMIVFTEYTETLEMLCREAEKRKIPFISYKSDTPESVLDTISNEFDANNHKSDKYKLLFCTDALAEGVSLHYAKHLVHFDSRWNPSRMIQREGRIDRICMDGNHHDITVYSFKVPYEVDREITLSNKIDRKTNEAELLLQYVKIQPEKEYVHKLDKLVLSEYGGAQLLMNETDKIIAIVGEKEFVFLSETTKVGRKIDFTFFSDGSPMTLYPSVRYMLRDDDLSKFPGFPGTIIQDFSEFEKASQEYEYDNRFRGIIEKDPNKFLYLTHHPNRTVRPLNPSYQFKTMLKSTFEGLVDKTPFKKYIPHFTHIFTNETFAYPLAKISEEIVKKHFNKGVKFDFPALEADVIEFYNLTQRMDIKCNYMEVKINL